MTDLVRQEAMRVAHPSTEIVAINPTDSPEAIQGPEDGEAALPHLFALFDEEMARTSYDAVVIACFDDTGLWTLKACSPVPVIGIGEASFHAAMLLAHRFSVVTTLAVSVPVLEDNIQQHGIGARCAKVRASDVPVLEIEANPELAHQKIEAEIALALAEDDIQAIVLGCAGMADIGFRLSQKFNIPVVDGVKAAIGLCEALEKVEAA